MPNLPPGLVSLVQKLPWLLSPSILTYNAIHALQRTFGWAFTEWAIKAAAAASLPLVFSLAAGWKRVRLSLDARGAGGALPRKGAFNVRDGLIWTVGGWPGALFPTLWGRTITIHFQVLHGMKLLSAVMEISPSGLLIPTHGLVLVD